jgi:hypothetical protein
MKIELKVEKIQDKIYIKCPICGDVLATNDPDYFFKKFHKNAVEPLSSCSHFEIVDVYKDEKSAKNIPFYEQRAVAKFEFKKYVSFIVPRES